MQALQVNYSAPELLIRRVGPEVQVVYLNFSVPSTSPVSEQLHSQQPASTAKSNAKQN